MKDWMVTLITGVLSHITPEMRQKLAELVQELEAKASETKNPWDDLGVAMLKALLGL